ncbi:hypothetical protein FRB95_003372 [Tulasnella sp. JGI-2019a]|nr:hypothetical protein FRB95_003372 [Tulasnella sp. JGI-2019a]
MPDDILESIARECTPNTLVALCLINKTLYNIAIIHLYRDPFTWAGTHVHEGSSDETWSAKLCNTIAMNPHLGSLVRSYRNPIGVGTGSRRKSMLTRAEEETILPCLPNLSTINLHNALKRFASLCPASRLNTIRLSATFCAVMDEATWRWVEGQSQTLRELDLGFHTVPLDITSSVGFPSLRSLGASPEAASIILPNASVQEFSCRYGPYAWTEESLTQIIPLLGTNLRCICHILLWSDTIQHFSMLLRSYCPNVDTIALSIEYPEMRGSNPTSLADLVISAIYDIPRLKTLVVDIRFDVPFDIDTERPMRMTKSVAESCPLLYRVQWTAPRREWSQLNRTVYSHTLDDGWWKTAPEFEID